MLTDKIIVTAALPYANSDLHLGHLRSTYLPADIKTRYLRLRGFEAIYICATDEHGTPIAIKAETDNVLPKQIADRYHESIIEDLISIGCSFDKFGRTTSSIHYKIVQDFFKKLLENGFIYKKEYEQLYCKKCKRFLPDRYVEGICPFCGEDKARGDSCEGCGRYLKPTELKKSNCAFCKSSPEIKKTDHWFFKLSAFEAPLKKWILENKDIPSNVRNYSIQWINEGLKDWCLTRDLEWGIPVPIENIKGKVIYVWFDAPIGYISTTAEWAASNGKPEMWKNFWVNKDAKIFHYIGKDIIYHHAIFWPAMLMAYGCYNLPSNIVAGEYLTLNGKKMSKSRGWLISVKDFVKKIKPDSLRYYLIVVAPLNKDADFSWNEFIRKNNDELADVLGNFIHRTLSFVSRFFGEAIPELVFYEKEDLALLEIINETKSDVEKFMEENNFCNAMKRIIELAAVGNRYLNLKKPWENINQNQNKEKASTTIYYACQIVKSLSVLLEPFLPFTAQNLRRQLNLKEDTKKNFWEEINQKINSGHKINKITPLFEKIEKDINK